MSSFARQTVRRQSMRRSSVEIIGVFYLIPPKLLHQFSHGNFIPVRLRQPDHFFKQIVINLLLPHAHYTASISEYRIELDDSTGPKNVSASWVAHLSVPPNLQSR